MRILRNLCREKAEIVIRFPIVPGFNDDAENIDRTGAFISLLPGVRRVNILPYHCAAVSKYKNLGLNYKTADIQPPCREYLESVAERLMHYHLEVKIGG